MQFQLIDVLTQDDDGNESILYARVESVQGDLYRIRYLSPTKKADIYTFESETYDIELQSIDYFYEDLEEFGFTEMNDGKWFKKSNEDNSDSTYTTEEEYETESEDESLYDEEDSEESSNV